MSQSKSSSGAGSVRLARAVRRTPVVRFAAEPAAPPASAELPAEADRAYADAAA
jgi:hypothetical protein